MKLMNPFTIISRRKLLLAFRNSFLLYGFGSILGPRSSTKYNERFARDKEFLPLRDGHEKIENLTDEQYQFLIGLNQLLSKKEFEFMARAKLLNEMFSKEKRICEEEEDYPAFYQIGLEVDYLNNGLEIIHTQKLLAYEGFFALDKEPECVLPTNDKWCQLVRYLWDGFKDKNREKIFEITDVWFRLKLNEDQFLPMM